VVLVEALLLIETVPDRVNPAKAGRVATSYRLTDGKSDCSGAAGGGNAGGRL